METQNKIRVRFLRKSLIRTYLVMLIPQLLLCVLFTQTTDNIERMIFCQLIWFCIYTSIILLLYILAPLKIKKQNKKPI